MKSQDAFQYLWHASIIANGLAFFAGLYCIKRLNVYLKILLLLVCVGLIIDIASFFLIKEKINNFYLFRFYSVFEFSLWVFFYFLFYKEHVRSYPIIFSLIPVFFVVCYIDYRFNGLNSMDDLSTSIESLILTFFSLVSFSLIMVRNNFKNLLSTPFFYINTGVLLYFLGNLSLFAFINYISKIESENYTATWAIHSILNIIFNLLLFIAFLKSKTKWIFQP